jgi:phosphatidate cytidylyltransferase
MIKKNLKKRIYTSLLLVLLIFLMLNYNIILAYTLIILGTLSIIEFLNLTKKNFKTKFKLLTSNFFFIIYILLFCYIFFFFSNILQLKLILFSILFCCIASDVGGFIFGKIFKGPKLTKISPNKTIIGSLGSIFLSIIIMSISIFYFTNSVNLKIIIIASLTSVATQLGDLFFSLLKRKAKIKDTGNFLPGHGGVLDRIDGILLGIPIGFISLVIFY